MIEGKVRLLLPNFLPQLKSAPGMWTLKKAHFNDYFELGDAGSWEDRDCLEWTSMVGVTQVTPAHFMLERNIDPSSNDN